MLCVLSVILVLIGLISLIWYAYTDHVNGNHDGILHGVWIFAFISGLASLIFFVVRPTLRKSGQEYLAEQMKGDPDGIW